MVTLLHLGPLLALVTTLSSSPSSSSPPGVSRASSQPHAAPEPVDEEIQAFLQDLDGERARQEPQTAQPRDEEPGGSSASAQPVEIVFCNTTCPKRSTCPLRAATRRLIQTHRAINALPEKTSAQQDWLETSLRPVAESFIQERLACAAKERELHLQAEEKAKAKAKEALLLAELILPTIVNEVTCHVKNLLREEALKTPPSSLPESPHPAPAPADEPGPEETLGDEEAWTLLQKARQQCPDDDAAAWRLLLETTNVTQNQAARIARLHNLPGWSKANLTNWRVAHAKSEHSLNKERQRAPPVPTPKEEGEHA